MRDSDILEFCVVGTRVYKISIPDLYSGNKSEAEILLWNLINNLCAHLVTLQIIPQLIILYWTRGVYTGGVEAVASNLS